VSDSVIEEALNDLLVWQCAYPQFQAPDILLHITYEEDTNGVKDNGADIPRAFCGHNSKQKPRTLWNSGVPLRTDSYVSKNS
jgi:hypothetical protein